VLTKIDIPTEITSLRSQLPQLRFPVANAKELLAQLTKPNYTVLGKAVTPAVGVSHVPATLFPIQSQADLEDKYSATVAKRAARRKITVTGYKPPVKAPVLPVRTVTPEKPA
jgi:hypothetical protein